MLFKIRLSCRLAPESRRTRAVSPETVAGTMPSTSAWRAPLARVARSTAHYIRAARIAHRARKAIVVGRVRRMGATRRENAPLLTHAQPLRPHQRLQHRPHRRPQHRPHQRPQHRALTGAPASPTVFHALATPREHAAGAVLSATRIRLINAISPAVSSLSLFHNPRLLLHPHQRLLNHHLRLLNRLRVVTVPLSLATARVA